MNVQRGDVLKARFPHASGERGKKRPVVVVQADVYNDRLRHAVVAEITGNLADVDDPACLFMDSSTPGAMAALVESRLPDFVLSADADERRPLAGTHR